MPAPVSKEKTVETRELTPLEERVLQIEVERRLALEQARREAEMTSEEKQVFYQEQYVRLTGSPERKSGPTVVDREHDTIIRNITSGILDALSQSYSAMDDPPRRTFIFKQNMNSEPLCDVPQSHMPSRGDAFMGPADMVDVAASPTLPSPLPAPAVKSRCGKLPG